MASRPLLYITDNLLKYWAVWSIVSSKLLFFAAHFPAATVMQGSHLTVHICYTFFLSPYLSGMFFFRICVYLLKQRVVLRDVFRITVLDYFPLRTFGSSALFLCGWNFLTLFLHVSFHFLSVDAVICGFLSLVSQGVYLHPMYFWGLAKDWYVFVHSSLGSEKYTLLALRGWDSPSVECEVLD